ncbi:uncharacterized protein Triagg1_8353 [Trichoderma aggressivum f. europaeum]|uniref:Uncharacterized protein n=1 Tax=Trichoderma aggressivum f. europaeum TaxID=173218 RepID=A0AAE1LXA4_9HYPO|nr:hypothetical protein Triagg1_8353 [Trichoderma aggressivum f. europaeum]
MKRFAVTCVSSACSPSLTQHTPFCSACTSDPWSHTQRQQGGQRKTARRFQPPDPVGFDGVTVQRLNRRNGARTSDLRRATAGQHPSHPPGRATCTGRLDWLALLSHHPPASLPGKSVMAGRVIGMTFPFYVLYGTTHWNGTDSSCQATEPVAEANNEKKTGVDTRLARSHFGLLEQWQQQSMRSLTGPGPVYLASPFCLVSLPTRARTYARTTAR